MPCNALWVDQLLLLRALLADDFFAPPLLEYAFFAPPLFAGRPALLPVPTDFFADLPFLAPFFADDFLAPLFAADFLAPFFGGGTFAPLSRASDNPIAIACLRLFTVLPLRPDFSFPRFISCIDFSTFFCAPFEYLAMGLVFKITKKFVPPGCYYVLFSEYKVQRNRERNDNDYDYPKYGPAAFSCS